MIRLTSRAEIRPLLERDRAWCAYAIGDLEPGLFELCEWYEAGGAIGLVFHGLPFVPLFTAGPAEGVGEILAALPLPHFYVNQRSEHLPAVERFYRVRDLRPMFRMTLDRLRPAPAETIAVGRERLEELQDLYAMKDAADAFTARQLEAGYFRGIERDGRLVCVAGIHVASPAYGVAAIGNVFTHPRYRGQGLAAACTTAVAESLHAAGCSTIILNVVQSNLAAVRLYERLGFSIHCDFFEGYADRR